jgi:hypothetical protein
MFANACRCSTPDVHGSQYIIFDDKYHHNFLPKFLITHRTLCIMSHPTVSLANLVPARKHTSLSMLHGVGSFRIYSTQTLDGRHVRKTIHSTRASGHFKLQYRGRVVENLLKYLPFRHKPNFVISSRSIKACVPCLGVSARPAPH